MNYVHLFRTKKEYIEKYNNSYKEPWLAYTIESEKTSFNEDPKEMYFTLSALENLTFTFTRSQNLTNPQEIQVNYSIDDGKTWTELAFGVSTPTIFAGQSIMLKSNITPDSNENTFTVTSTGHFTACGNPLSLLLCDNFKDVTDLTGKDGAFLNLFYNATGLTSASMLSLPATTLSKRCYSNMFNGCSYLTTAPELPATTLAPDCYYNMFNGCSSLTTAPELPAMEMKEGCYLGMFKNCTSLENAPSLPANILAINCYGKPYQGSSTLGMFQGCTSLINAPELTAETLAEGCYAYMFADCSNIKHIKMLATDISAQNCLQGWVSGVASTGTFVKHPSMTTLPRGDNGIPTGWTVETESE